MKFAHKVFHIDSDSERDWLTKSINLYLSRYSDELDTPTIQIRSLEDLSSYRAHNPDFILDAQGYNLDGIQGWKFGEIGIWASNYAAWKKFINSDYDAIVLMEDDIVFNDNFFPLIEKYLNELPNDWDMFSFFVPQDQMHLYNNGLSVQENVSIAYQDWSCLCYVLSKSGAQKSLNIFQEKTGLPLDWFFYRQKNKFNIFSIKPNSSQGCTLAKLESTFQKKHERQVINGIF